MFANAVGYESIRVSAQRTELRRSTSRYAEHASVVRGRSLSVLIDLVMIGEADVIAAQKTNLYNIAPRLPGSRVLDGRPGSEEQALAIPKGRDAIGLEYLRGFVQDAKNRGLVKRAIDRVGIRGVVVPP
jgi:polar amino acid transport system substrate-binding protein